MMKLSLLKLELARRRKERKRIKDARTGYRSPVAQPFVYGQTAIHFKGCFKKRPELDNRSLSDLSHEEFVELYNKYQPYRNNWIQLQTA